MEILETKKEGENMPLDERTNEEENFDLEDTTEIPINEHLENEIRTRIEEEKARIEKKRAIERCEREGHPESPLYIYIFSKRGSGIMEVYCTRCGAKGIHELDTERATAFWDKIIEGIYSLSLYKD